MSLKAVNWTKLGATKFVDYTQPVLDIVDSVQNHSNVSLCCQYEFQLLDKFCARQTVVSCTQLQNVTYRLFLVVCLLLYKQTNLNDTCSAVDAFGYRYCLDCLG